MREYIRLSKADYNRLKAFFQKGNEIPLHVLETFINIANGLQLNPFLGEIMLIPYGETYDIRIGKNGLLALANRQPDFISVDVEVIHEKDEFSYDAANRKITHKIGLPTHRGGIVGAWARVNRRDRPPTIVVIPLAEYFNGDSNIWTKYTSAMIKKVALSIALRQTYGITGLYTRAEMGEDDYEEAIMSPEIEDILEDLENDTEEISLLDAPTTNIASTLILDETEEKIPIKEKKENKKKIVLGAISDLAIDIDENEEPQEQQEEDEIFSYKMNNGNRNKDYAAALFLSAIKEIEPDKYAVITDQFFNLKEDNNKTYLQALRELTFTHCTKIGEIEDKFREKYAQVKEIVENMRLAGDLNFETLQDTINITKSFYSWFKKQFKI